MCVMDSPALRKQRAIYTVKYVNSLITWQHRLDVDSNFLSYPALIFVISVADSLELEFVTTLLAFHKNSNRKIVQTTIMVGHLVA